MVTYSERIARFALELDYDDLPESTIQAAVTAIADTIACAVAATSQPPVEIVREYATSKTGKQTCSLIGTSLRTDAPLAALVNATAARDLDANDLYATAPGRDTGHFSDAIPALLAIAEESGASGHDLILATVVAYEVQAALAESYLWMERGFHSVSQVSWAVPAAVGKMTGLSETRIASAIGLAGSTAGLILQSWLKPSKSIPMLKAGSAGFAAMRGLEAAELARLGFTAPDDSIETLFGRFHSNDQPWRFDRLEQREQFAIERTIVKRFPSQIYTQAAVEAAIDLYGQVKSTDEIAVVTLYGHRNVAAGVQGSGAAYTPETREAADHSTPFVIAMALRDGFLTPESFGDEPWREEAVIDLMRRIDLVIDPAADQAFSERGEIGCRLVLERVDGSVSESTVTQPSGHPDRPLSREQLETKLATLVDPILGAGSGERLLLGCEALTGDRSPSDVLSLVCRE